MPVKQCVHAGVPCVVEEFRGINPHRDHRAASCWSAVVPITLACVHNHHSKASNHHQEKMNSTTTDLLLAITNSHEQTYNTAAKHLVIDGHRFA